MSRATGPASGSRPGAGRATAHRAPAGPGRGRRGGEQADAGVCRMSRRGRQETPGGERHSGRRSGFETLADIISVYALSKLGPRKGTQGRCSLRTWG